MTACATFPCRQTSDGHCPSCNPRPTTLSHPNFHPPIKALWEYSDDEIAREYHNRALKKLGDQRVGVGLPFSNGDQNAG